MKTSAETVVKAGVGLTQRLFSRVMMALCVPAPATITSPLVPLSRKNRAPNALSMTATFGLGMAQLAGGLMVTVALALVALAGVLSPIQAEAKGGYQGTIAGGTNLERMCVNCHASWDGGGNGNAGRMNYYIWTGGNGATPTADGFALTDIDMDGTATGLSSGTPPGEYGNARSLTPPPDTVDWVPFYADKDNDGCIQLYSRNTEIGIVDPPVSVMSHGYVGAPEGFRWYGPKGWDIDDNDATLVGGIPTGCNASYPDWPINNAPGTIFTNAGSTNDSIPPGKITDLRGSSLVPAALPLVWTAPADDGLAGVAAHSYDLKYSTSILFAKAVCSGPGSDVAGATACNPRDPAHWRRLWNYADVQIRTGGWNAGATAPLMRALYEPVPTNPGSQQLCNSVGLTASPSCPSGASFAIKVQGDSLQTNVIGTALYWVAIRTSDGVLGPTALTNAGAPVAFENLSPVSNIVGITAGVAGAAITSYTPSITTATTNSVTVTGRGINTTNAAGVRLINAAGAIITGTITTPANGTSVVANFNGTGAYGSYTLETLNGAGASTAAWVDAVSVVDTLGLISINPPVFGQGAINKTVQFIGSGLSGGTADFTGTGITPDPATLSGSASPWSTTISVSSTATPGNVSVTTGGGTSAPVAYTITAAPSHNCAPPANGTVGVAYGPYTCTGSGVVPPFTWLTSVPAGLSSVPSGTNNATLTISGTPSGPAGPFTGQIRVVDANSGTFETLPTFNIAPHPDFTVTSTAVNGTITSTNPVLVPSGGTTTVTGTSNANHYFTGVSGCGGTTQTNTNQAVTTFSYTTAPITANCTVTANFAIKTYTVTPSATTGGSITPATPVTVNHNATTTFTVIADSGSTASVGGTCGGSLAGSTYTTNPIVADCTVIANFFGGGPGTVTSTAVNGTITSTNPVTVPAGQTTTVTGTANANHYFTGVSGCGGTAQANTNQAITTFSYTTGPINANCTVAANFAIKTYTVTPSEGTNPANGSITPATPVTVNHGATTTFTVTADSGYTASVGGTCGGTLAGSTYTTNAITANCTVVASSYPPIQGSNLEVSALTASLDPLIADGLFIASNTVSNTGTAAAGSFTVKLYLSPDPVVTGVTGSGDIYLGMRPISSLAAGASNTANTSLRVPGTVSSGSYYLGAIADTANTVVETNENDNTRTTAVTVRRDVDLVVSSIGTTSTNVGAGASFQLNNTVTNNGTTPMTASSTTVHFYLSLDNIVTGASGSGDILIGTRTVLRLGAGASSNALTTVKVPSTIFGSTTDTSRAYYIGAFVDATNTQKNETNNGVPAEDNNILVTTTPITVFRSVDLTVSGVTPSVMTIGANEVLSVSSTVKNTGTTQMTATSTTVRFHLVPTAGGTEILLGSKVVSSACVGGVSGCAFVASMTVPATTIPATYWLKAKVDATNTQLEVNETNNEFTTTASISVIRDVNLVISLATTGTTTVVRGTSFIVLNTESNIGTTKTTASANSVKFYLTTAMPTTVAGAKLGLQIGARLVGALAAGASNTADTAVTVPSTMTPGTYYLSVVADATNAQVENNDEDNFTVVGPVNITMQ